MKILLFFFLMVFFTGVSEPQAHGSVVDHDHPQSICMRDRGVPLSGSVHHSGEVWDSSRLAGTDSVDVSINSVSSGNVAPHCVTSTVGTKKSSRDIFPDTKASLAPQRADADLKGSRTGRISFRNTATNKDGHCTASVLATSSGSVLITAAHCVHGGRDGDLFEDIVFMPGYSDGDAPYGHFAVSDVFYHSDWSDYGGLDYGDAGVYRGYNADFAFLVVDHNSEGNTPMSYVGGHDIEVNDFTSFYSEAYGYPDDQGDGELLTACKNTTSTASFFDDGWGISFMTMLCSQSFGPGASGGPWVADVEGAPLRTQVKSATSWRDSGSGTIHGPYLDNRAWDLLIAAEEKSYGG